MTRHVTAPTWAFLGLTLALVAGALPAKPSAASSARPVEEGERRTVEDLVVGFAPGAAPDARHRALAAGGLVEVDEMPGSDFVLARVAAAPAGRGAGPALEALHADRAVASAQTVATMHALDVPHDAVSPDDPLFPHQWDLRAIGIPEAWAASTGSGAVVAVIDTGVAFEDVDRYRKAPDLAGTSFVPGWDFVDGDNRPDDEAEPGLPTHGTHIATTIAATTGNGVGTAAVAPGATIMAVRVLEPDRSGTSWDIAQGLRFAADHGATIANLSLGGPAGSPELAEAVAYAASKGVLMIAASGDESTPAVDFPAAYPEVVAVGAVRADLSRPPYSNQGPELDLMAPGGDRSMDQNGDGFDDGLVAQTVFGQQGSFCFCSTEGTSSAAAEVSGVAALVWSELAARGPAPEAATVRAALVGGTLDLGPPGRDDEFGAGLVQAGPSLASALSLASGQGSTAAHSGGAVGGPPPETAYPRRSSIDAEATTPSSAELEEASAPTDPTVDTTSADRREAYRQARRLRRAADADVAERRSRPDGNSPARKHRSGRALSACDERVR